MTVAATLQLLPSSARTLSGGSNLIMIKTTPTGETVVHKTVAPPTDVSPSRTLRAARAEQLAREAEILTGLTPHPNIVGFRGLVTGDQGAALELDFVPGHALGHYVRHQPLDWPEATLCMADLARALRHLLRNWIVYCDLKPDNCVFTGETCVLIDFGISLQVGDDRYFDDDCPVITGSLGYMSKSVLRGERPTVADDVWGLGRTIVAALLGRHLDTPKTGQTSHEYAYQLLWQPPPILTNHFTIPTEYAGFVRLLQACLDDDPTQRPSLDAIIAFCDNLLVRLRK